MKTKSANILRGMMISVAILDFLTFEISLILGYWLWIAFPWHGNWQYLSEYAQVLWGIPPIGVVVFRLVGLYKPEMGVMAVQEQTLIFKAVWIIYICGFALSFFYRDAAFSRLAVFYSMFISLGLISFERLAARKVFSWLNEKGIGVRNALIYGAGYHGQRLERWIHQSPKLGIKVVGYLDDNPGQLIKKPTNLETFGAINLLPKLVKQKNIELLFVAHRKLGEEKVIDTFQKCRELGIQCWTIPSLYAFHIEKAELFNIGGIPLVGFRGSYGRRSYALIKRFFDFLISLILIAISLPLITVIALIVSIHTKGNLFFIQERVGKDGKKFHMLKFRTLKVGSGKNVVSPELQKSNEEILPFGAFLRHTGLDELPQLFNVLKGDMSLVGPRPEMVFITKNYGPLERERLSVKPGITGLWQISDDRKRLLIHENMDYDLYYIEQFSFNLDLAIISKTVFVLLDRFIEALSKAKKRKEKE